MTESGKPVPNEIIHASDIYSKDEVNDLIVNKTRVNLLRPSLVTTTKNGVTCTDNGDGTYTINGTASGYTSFTIGRVHIEKDKKYRVVGCPSGGTYESGVGYKLFVDYDGTYAIDYGESQTFEPTNESISSATIQVNTDTVCDNLLFKPMITDDLSATYDDFVSYNDSFVTGINSGINIDLLWTNRDSSVSWPSGSLALDLSSYKLICMVVRTMNAADGFISFILIKDLPYQYLHGQELRESYVCLNQRRVDVSNNGIQFYENYRTGSYNNAALNLVNNNALIPDRIYGIK